MSSVTVTFACHGCPRPRFQVHSIMRHVAETTGRDLEALYDNIAWPLYKVGPGDCVSEYSG